MVTIRGIECRTIVRFRSGCGNREKRRTLLNPFSWRIGNFTDYREIENGEYIDRGVEMVDRSPEERVIEWLDHEFGLDNTTYQYGKPHYYGDPYGDEPMFDWRKCED